MADVDHGDHFAVIIDAIADPVLPAARSPLTLERFAQRRPDPMRINDQRPVQELDTGHRHFLRQPLGQLTSCRPGDLNPVGHRSLHAR